MQEYDVLIIGGGVVGCAIARELSRYSLDLAVLEKESDVGTATSGRNSGVSHAGFYVPNNTLKAALNVKGHSMLPSLCGELGVPYEEIGKLVVAKNPEETDYLKRLKEKGEKNGVKTLRILGREEVRGMEPKIDAVAALYSPTSAILDPFELTIALAENAAENGAEFMLETEVCGIEKDGIFRVKTNRGEYRAKAVINSAGLCSGKVAEMAGVAGYMIHPCRGEYHILDRECSKLIKHLIYPVPPKDVGGLGVHLTPTVHGNIMLGPSAEHIEQANYANTCDVMDLLIREAKDILPEINRKDIIRSFSGVRPKLTPPGSTEAADFIIEDSSLLGLVNLIGIESPGLTAAPAIAEMVREMVGRIVPLRKKEDFKKQRKAKLRFASLTDEEKSKLIEKDPAYGEIVCRCETVTKREVLDALNNSLGAKNIDAIKRRCRAGTGRCQSGFCLPKIVEIMEEEGINVEEMRLNSKGSELFTGRVYDEKKS